MLLVVPPFDPEAPWPTLGPQVIDFLHERAVFGPGSLKGIPAKVDEEKQALITSFYEVYPQGHPLAGRRRFKRCGYCIRKGVAKTELGAWIAYVELHPEGPVRCDGFDAHGEPVGRPVRDPYIPLLAADKEQVEELAFGALYVVVTEGPDADLFDAGLERIIRLDEYGRSDGKAVPLANSPSARDGARTSFQMFDEPHRLTLPRQLAAHETMVANLEKRVLEDPWGLYVGTAGEPGEGSVAEGLHSEAESIDRGEVDEPQLSYVYRAAGPGYKINVEELIADGMPTRDARKFAREQRVLAVREATGPLIPEYGPGQFLSIARQWERKGADLNYLERVWLNRWVRASSQAFDPSLRKHLLRKDDPFKRGELVVAGFDGARYRDSTAIVLTHVETGRQKLWGLWEREKVTYDHNGDAIPWEVPVDEVHQSVDDMMRFFDVWRFNCDPPYWVAEVATWNGKYKRTESKGRRPADIVDEFHTSTIKMMALAIKAYTEAYKTGAVTFVDDLDEGEESMEVRFARHSAAAGKRLVKLWDDDEEKQPNEAERAKGRGQQLYILRKLHPDRKFDAQMAAILSWEAFLVATAKDAQPTRRRGYRVKRL